MSSSETYAAFFRARYILSPTVSSASTLSPNVIIGRGYLLLMTLLSILCKSIEVSENLVWLTPMFPFDNLL